MTSRRRPLPAAGPDLWLRDDVGDALARRDLGTVIRIYRKYTGATQSQIAAAVDVPQPHVSDIEHGRRQVIALDLFERFADGLQIPRARIGLADAPAAGADPLHASFGVVPSVGVRPHVERAFAAAEVSLDFAGFSGETLHGAVQEPLDKIRAGLLRPASLVIRILLPDTDREMALPCRADDFRDDPDFRARSGAVMRRHAQAMIDSVDELRALELVARTAIGIRRHSCSPLFKLFVLNEEEALFGLYRIRQHRVDTGSAPHEVLDLMGKETPLFHHTVRDDDSGATFVAEARTWFDSMWNGLGRPYEP